MQFVRQVLRCCMRFNAVRGPLTLRVLFSQEALLSEYDGYITAHPELAQMLHDFTTACLAERPADVTQFAKVYFRKFEQGPSPDEKKVGIACCLGVSASLFFNTLTFHTIVWLHLSGAGQTLILTAHLQVPSITHVRYHAQ